jgi:plastocyanin
MLIVALLFAAAPARPPPATRPDWLGTEMPLPLAVRTAQDLEFKNVAERQYLIFNLLAAGKVAFDRGDYVNAAAKWDALLQLPGVDPQLERAVRPLLDEAHAKAGTAVAARPAPPAQPAAGEPPPRKREVTTTVEGSVSGGGTGGPGGAVVSLKRLDGPSPRPTPARKVVLQKDKSFVPRVLAVGVGSSVVFRNADEINHNVFSLSPRFDTGLYGRGGEKVETFDKPGVVQLLCNIHSSMLGYVVVVDTPWFAQADASGAFTIRGVPPGEYEVSAWHENSSKVAKQRVTVAREGARVSLRVGDDRQPPAFPPDKYGKPRQPQLGY